MGYTQCFGLELLPRNVIIVFFRNQILKNNVRMNPSTTKSQKQSILEAIIMFGRSLM